MKKGYYENRNDLWQSYSDMLSALMLVFVLIMSVVVIKNNSAIKEKRELSKVKDRLLEENKKINAELNKISNLRAAINKGLKDEEYLIRDKKGNVKSILIRIENGVMLLDSGILFESGKSSLSTEAKDILRQCLASYFDHVFSKENREKISGVIVEGHTDKQPFHGAKGPDENYIKNMELSQQRALEVVRFCLNEPTLNKYRPYLRSHIFAEGKSFSEHKGPKDNWKESRTVKVKYRVKEEEKGI